MLPDVQGVMFIRDGVGPDLIRAGEPRLQKRRGSVAAIAQRAAVRRPVSLLRRVLRPVTS